MPCLVPPVFVGPNDQVVSTIANHRVMMRCQFESYPPPQIQWIKMSRTVQDPEGRVLAMDIDNGVNDITTKQVGSTLYESVLSVISPDVRLAEPQSCFQYTPSERDFGLSFECRALNPRVGRHSYTLQRAEPPKKVRVEEVKPSTNAADILVKPPENGGLPLVEYIVKYDILNETYGESQTLTVPGT
jgi:hypothetical protein